MGIVLAFKEKKSRRKKSVRTDLEDDAVLWEDAQEVEAEAQVSLARDVGFFMSDHRVGAGGFNED